MNRHTARALVQDAFYQVLDNKVFRLLVIVSICLIAPTFLIAFKPDEVSVLFGWKTFSYSDVSWLVGNTNPLARDANVHAIQNMQSVFIESLAGNFGIMFCLAATAFFVPRMLEKGEADTLFSKPVGRFVLLFARYVSGVMFVGVLAFVLVLGMHLGLLLRSGYSDPGFLWGALTLVYIFALIHAFSTMVGVITRSSVAALLLSILLFWFNGCIQQVWVMKEYGVEVERVKLATSEDDPAAPRENELDTPALRTLFAVLDGFHFALPKTHDADVLTRKLRTVVAGIEFVLVDPAGKLAIDRDPKGLTRSDAAPELDLSQTPAVWTAQAGGREVARVTVARHLRVAERKSGDKVRKVRTSANAAATELMKSLEARTDLDGKPERMRAGSDGLPRDIVRWKEKGADGTRVREHAFLPIDDWMYAIDLTADPDWFELDAHDGTLSSFMTGLKPQRDAAGDLMPPEWYEKRFGWTAPLRFNAFFSLATSLAFATLMLVIARWRLSRIDF